MGDGLIEHFGCPLLVLGGPGTGKTSFLERRFLHLATEAGIEPHRILLLCGSRTYAARARDRLARQLPLEAAIEVPVYTWHGLAYHLVTRHYPELGFSELPVLLTAPEQWGTVRELLDAEDPAVWPSWADRLGERAFTDEVADFCLRVGQLLLGPDELEQTAQARPDWSEVIRFAGTYRNHLLARSRMDYAQLLGHASRLLSDNSSVAEALRARFPDVLVDDGQDLGHAHLALLHELETSNLVVAADPDCGVEAFRGARPDWVFGFEKDFGPARIEVLRRSYRLGAPLAGAARRLIASNETSSRHRITVEADHKTEFECRQYASSIDEVESIARELKRAHLIDGVPRSEMAGRSTCRRLRSAR
jgi:superfamily I DNA/RNA helicase